MHEFLLSHVSSWSSIFLRHCQSRFQSCSQFRCQSRFICPPVFDPCVLLAFLFFVSAHRSFPLSLCTLCHLALSVWIHLLGHVKFSSWLSVSWFQLRFPFSRPDAPRFCYAIWLSCLVLVLSHGLLSRFLVTFVCSVEFWIVLDFGFKCSIGREGLF